MDDGQRHPELSFLAAFIIAVSGIPFALMTSSKFDSYSPELGVFVGFATMFGCFALAGFIVHQEYKSQDGHHDD